MSFVDREVLLGRTPRELVCIAGGLAITIFELVRPGEVDVPNLAVYVGATLLFAVRFYAARAAAVAACLGACVQQWPHLRMGEVTWETLGLFPLAAFVVLASEDLVERFERAPSRVRWLPNLWSSFTAAQTRTLRWSAYAAGALAGLLDHITEQIPAGAAAWPRPSMIALTVALVLLCAGRAVALLVLWATSLAVAVVAIPLVAPAEATLADFGVRTFTTAGPPLPAAIAGAHLYILPTAALAVVALALTTPTVVRLLRRTLLG